MLSTSRGLYAAAQWVICQGVLQQFQIAYETQQEATGGYAPFQPLRDWTPPPSRRRYAGESPDPPSTPLDLPRYPRSMVRKADILQRQTGQAKAERVRLARSTYLGFLLIRDFSYIQKVEAYIDLEKGPSQVINRTNNKYLFIQPL